MEDPDPEGNAEVDGDPEILEGNFDDLLERVTDEIRWREQVLGDLYPFELRMSGRGWNLRRRTEAVDSQIRTARNTYIACLLMSAARHGRIPGIPSELVSIKAVADAFQAAVYLVAPAFLGGGSFWMGFPRPEGDGYMDALRRLVDAVGVGIVSSTPPTSQKKNKDGGVDVVSWRRFPDGRSNLMMSYGQVATGKDWREKSVANKFVSHFQRWFSVPPATHYVPAMYIPHVMHEDIEGTPSSSFAEISHDDAMTLEASLGVVVDRIRLASLVPVALQLREGRDASLMKHIRALARWKASVAQKLGVAA
ncbi:hypothetical protein [Microbacterium sp. BF1]|nr:hypothetical protein [Microbacterium sp. BF1]